MEINRVTTGRERDVIHPTHQAVPGALHSVLFWLEKAQRKAAKGQRAGETSLWRRTESVRSFHTGEGLGETLSHYSSTYSVAITRTEALSSQRATWKSKWQWVQIVPTERFFLDTRNFFTERTLDPWNNLPRDVLESLSLEVFKMWLNRLLNNLIYHPFPTKGCSWWYFEAPSDLSCFVILWPQLHLQPSPQSLPLLCEWVLASSTLPDLTVTAHIRWNNAVSSHSCCLVSPVQVCGGWFWGSPRRKRERRAGSAPGPSVLLWVQPPSRWPPPPSVQICLSAQVWQICPGKGTTGRLGLEKQHEKCA